MSIQRRLYLLALMAVLPALTIHGYRSAANYQALERDVHTEMGQMAALISGEVDRIIDMHRVVMEAFAEFPAVIAQDAAGCSAYARRVASRHPSLVSLVAFDRHGETFCWNFPAINATGTANKPTSVDEYSFAATRDSGKFAVGTLTVGEITQKPTLTLTLPHYDATGAFAGVISGGLNLQWLHEYLSNKPLPPNSSLVIADREGTILLRVPTAVGMVGRKLLPSVAWMVNAPQAGTAKSVTFDGIERIIGFVPAPVPPIGILVAVGVDRGAAMAPLRLAAVQDLTLFLGILILALSAAAWGGKAYIGRPLEHLAETARRWAAGDRAARATLHDRHSEIGTVGITLNHMAEVIAKRERDLEAEIGRRDVALAQKALLTEELNHRVKNTLFTVQAIARMSLRDVVSRPEAPRLLEARLQAMARAHDVLTRESWEGAGIDEIVADAVAPYAGRGTVHVAAAAVDVRLTPRQALALAMGLHELCTNAAKYGALSTPEGRVDISWRLNDSLDRLLLTWRESGGPAVERPKRYGFGFRMVQRVLAQDMDGHVVVEFDPGGLICTIDAAMTGQRTPSIDHAVRQAVKTGGPA